MKRTKSRRISLLRKLRNKKSSYEDTEHQPSLPLNRRSPTALAPSLNSRLPPTTSIQEPLSNEAISKDFSILHNAILSHVQKFYSTKHVDADVSQAMVKHACTGINLPRRQILGLLRDPKTRLAALALCIAWTILSRSLLRGINNSPESTFLSPEIVECFQRFSFSEGAVLGVDAASPANFALLSCWKQISATLLHETYVTAAFSHLDSRTINIERALKDLDPLLAAYADPRKSGHDDGARVIDLRDVLRTGANFAFELFSQPSFWGFDWTSNRATKQRRPQLDSETILSPGFATTSSNKLTTSEIVVWPCLRRVMNGEGVRLDGEGDGLALGQKKYVLDLADI